MSTMVTGTNPAVRAKEPQLLAELTQLNERGAADIERIQSLTARLNTLGDNLRGSPSSGEMQPPSDSPCSPGVVGALKDTQERLVATIERLDEAISWLEGS